MASASVLLIMFSVFVATISTTTLATEHIVGGASGWTVGFNYTTWAEQQTFVVGDTIVFRYPVGAHNVHKVNVIELQNCQLPYDSTAALTSGNDTVLLKTPGPKWYTCGVTGHCEAGQKLTINVVEASSPAPAPAAPAAPTSTSNGFKLMTTSVYNLFMVIMATIAIPTFFMI